MKGLIISGNLAQDHEFIYPYYRLLEENIDLDVSKILSREMNLDQAGDELIKATLKVANGRLTCAEALGHKEFVMTKLYRSA